MGTMAHLKASSLLKFVEILNLTRGQMMECYCRETPRFPVEPFGELVQLSDIGILEDRPRIVQRNSGISKNLAQDTITRPVPVGVFVQLHSAAGVLIRGELHRWIGDNEAGTAMCEDDVRNLGLGANVVGLFGIEVREPLHKRRPGKIGVCFHKDIPFGIVLMGQSPLDHREEFPFVQLPPWVIRFANVRVRFIGKVGGLKPGAPLLAQAVVEVEIGDRILDCAVHGEERVVHFDAFNFFLKVGKDDVVWNAAEGSLEVYRDFVEGFGDAGFHHHQHVFHPLEGGAFGDLSRGGIRRAARGARPGETTAGVKLRADGEEVVEKEDAQEGGENCDATKATDGHCGVALGGE